MINNNSSMQSMSSGQVLPVTSSMSAADIVTIVIVALIVLAALAIAFKMFWNKKQIQHLEKKRNEAWKDANQVKNEHVENIKEIAADNKQIEGMKAVGDQVDEINEGQKKKLNDLKLKAAELKGSQDKLQQNIQDRRDGKEGLDEKKGGVLKDVKNKFKLLKYGVDKLLDKPKQ